MRKTTARGFTLIEMMIALAVGLLVVLSASALLRNARAVYGELDDGALIQETGRLSLSHLRTMLSQAHHLPWESALQAKAPLSRSAGLRGLDDRSNASSLDPRNASFDAGSTAGINQSDILMIGFFGTPNTGHVSSCGSGALTSAKSDGTTGTESRRNWVIYYISQKNNAEPELRCRFVNNDSNWGDHAVAPGIESMQILYGVDSDAVSGADRWYSASQMEAALWKKVRLVRISLLVRGRYLNDHGDKKQSFDLLGPGPHAVHIGDEKSPKRMRAVFETTVMLRNVVPGDEAPT
jgi:type IV pilus assembly protein PilW